MKFGPGFWGITKVLLLLFLVGALHLNAATLRWAPNSPDENVAFYTVYIQSASGTATRQVRGEPALPLDELLPDITYTLSVSATSIEGIESVRSAGVPYILGFPVPTITSDPESKALPAGTPIVLSVSATGPSGLKYEWYKNNQPIAGAFLPLLSILASSPADSGSYVAVVSTPGGHVESQPAQIIVQDPPRIITQPSSAALGVGTPFALSVNASGTDLRYQWYKAGQPLLAETNSSLEFPQLTIGDKGLYRVGVSNLGDRISSETAILDVFYIPVSFTGGPYSTNLIEGGTIRLTATVNGSPPFTFQWQKNGIPLFWATNATLVISSA